jgi:23S rRNA pseudouridine2604 synthase
MEALKRLNKFIGETGFCSRREADVLIEQNRVTVNGKPAEMGMKVSNSDEVRIDGEIVGANNGKPVYLAFNKPVGIECTTNTDVADNIVDYINYPVRIFPIGRLDKASEGLIFMTNDGDIVNKILRARNNHEKEYTVTVNKPITERFIQKMGNGVPILDTVIRKCHVEQISKYVFKIILTQGLNRQIRRMCEYLGYDVTALKRIRIINISLDVPLGKYRELTDDEIKSLNKLIEPSSKTEEASLPKEGNQLSAVSYKPKSFQSGTYDSNSGNGESGRKRPATGNSSRPATKDQRPATNDQRPKTNNQRPTTNDQRPPTNNQRPKTNNQRPPTNSPRKIEIIKKDDPRYRKKGDY